VAGNIEKDCYFPRFHRQNVINTEENMDRRDSLQDRTVIGIGEVLLDIVFRNGQPESASVGGSVVNSLVSLARSGVSATLIGAVGDDNVGKVVLQFLEKESIDTKYLTVHKGAKTPVSIAVLDENGNASYSFYHIDKMLPSVDLKSLEFDRGILLVGSYYSVAQETHPFVSELLRKSIGKDVISVYDLNFRPAHKESLSTVKSNILENIKAADILRCSREDLLTVFGTDDVMTVFKERLNGVCRQMICTDGGNAIMTIDEEATLRTYPVPATSAVNTIGAGDNFNAGLIYGIVCNSIEKLCLHCSMTDAERNGLIANAIAFATNSCQQTSNYISPSFGNEKKNGFVANV